jgi:hypothetical protein
MKHRPSAIKIATRLGLLAVAGLAVMAIAGPSSASAAVICATNLDGDPNIPGRQCPDGFEYGNDNPNYAYILGNFRIKMRAGTEAVFTTSQSLVIECNRSVGNGRIADSGAADGVPDGFLFTLHWQQKEGPNVHEACPTNEPGLTANVNADGAGTGPGIWDLEWAWLADGVPPVVNGTMTILDLRATLFIQQNQCFLEGDTDGDHVINEGDRAAVLDLFNPLNVDFVDEDLVESLPQRLVCPDFADVTADYVLKGDTQDDADAVYKDNLFIRQDDA